MKNLIQLIINLQGLICPTKGQNFQIKNTSKQWEKKQQN